MGENNAMFAYAPMIDAKPTDMKTVYNTMKKSKQMTEELGQKTTVQTMDQQLNAIHGLLITRLCEYRSGGRCLY